MKPAGQPRRAAKFTSKRRFHVRLSHWFDDLPLRGKLYLCLVIFVIVPLLAVAVFINVQISSVMIKNARETRMQVLKQTRPPIEGLVRDLELISLTLLSDDKMQELIQYHIGNTGQDLESRAYDFNVSIQPLMVSRPYIWSICVSRGKTVIFQYGDRVNTEDPQFENAAASLKGRPFWTSVYNL
jgi:two-component system sensor histidine kinase YesM